MKDLVQATAETDGPRCDHPVAEIVQIVRDIRFDLAALLPNPQNWCADQWPVKNPADAAMLAEAYTKLTYLLNAFDDVPDEAPRSIASGFQDIRDDLAEIFSAEPQRTIVDEALRKVGGETS